jgi:hypothetical protein
MKEEPMSKKQELATPAPGGVVVPDYAQGAALGMENVGREDVSIPRYSIIQSLSPERQKSDAKYIPGVEEGQIINSVTGEVLPEAFDFVDVFYQRTYGVFVKRDAGGGFRGNFNTVPEAQAFVVGSPDGSSLEVMDTGVHVIVRLDDAGAPIETAILYMCKSKLRVSRKINTVLKGKGVARFATTWNMGTVSEKAPKGVYYNWKVEDKGWTPKDLFDYCKQVYDEVKTKDLGAAAEAAGKDAAHSEVEY